MLRGRGPGNTKPSSSWLPTGLVSLRPGARCLPSAEPPVPGVHRLSLPPRGVRGIGATWEPRLGGRSSPGLPFISRSASPVAFQGLSLHKRAFSRTGVVRYKPHVETGGHGKGRRTQRCLGRRGMRPELPAGLL